MERDWLIQLTERLGLTGIRLSAESTLGIRAIWDEFVGVGCSFVCNFVLLIIPQHPAIAEDMYRAP
jgi:hypothetical protein